jgi:hypothetical protein
MSESTFYVKKEELKATLEISGQVFAEEDVNAARMAASRAVDNICGRWFYAHTGAASARYFEPLNSNRIHIDDAYEVSAVKTDQDGDGTFELTWTANTGYILEPLNAAADGWPWTTLRRHPNESNGFPYYYPRSVEVTAKWGWAAVPAPIKEATTILAAALLKRSREAPFGVVAIGIDVGSAVRIARSDPHVAALLSGYVREKP